MPKNIVVFSDGTGQEGGKGYNTNIYKIYNMIEDRSIKQISFYDRGLGIGWIKMNGKAFGLGFSKNIKDCYEFIFNNILISISKSNTYRIDFLFKLINGIKFNGFPSL